MRQHRILYVGHDLRLLQSLQDTLGNCRIVRCPAGSVARTLIEHINYSLLLFNKELPGTPGTELARFVLRLPQQRRTPIIMIETQSEDGFVSKPGDIVKIVETIARLLAPSGNPF
jgi:DNA-binding response OmpR family regulator